jgi:hypothetical protein
MRLPWSIYGSSPCGAVANAEVQADRPDTVNRNSDAVNDSVNGNGTDNNRE